MQNLYSQTVIKSIAFIVLVALTLVALSISPVGAVADQTTPNLNVAVDCVSPEVEVPDTTNPNGHRCEAPSSSSGSLDLKDNIGCGSDFDTTKIGTAGTCVSANDGSELSETIKTILNVFSWIVGVASVIMIIFAGFKYVISQGSSEGVSGARNTILYAIIGLVVVALAQTIVRFVVGKL